MSSRLGDKLPRVTSSIPRDLRVYLDRVRDVMNGAGGEIVTTPTLQQLGLLDNTTTTTVVNQTIIDENVGTPPAITNFSVDGAFQNIILSWDVPSYYGHAYAEVWGSDIFEDSLTQVEKDLYNNLENAGVVGITSGGVHTDYIGGGKGRYYWVRSVNINGVAGPFNAVEGLYGFTAPDVDLLLDTLNGSITEGQLYSSLASSVGTIPNLNDQYTIKLNTNGAISGFGLASEPSEAGGATTSFAVNADRFYIYPDTDYSQVEEPATPSEGQVWYKEGDGYYLYEGGEWVSFVPESPFIVQTTPVVVNGVSVPVGVYMRDAFIANGSISNAKIGELAVDTANIANAAITELKVEDGAITNLKIGDFIQSTATTQFGQPNWKIDKTGGIVARQIEIRDNEDNLLLSSGNEFGSTALSGALAPEVYMSEEFDYFTSSGEFDYYWTNYAGDGETIFANGQGEYAGAVLQIGNNSGNDQQWLIYNKSFFYRPERVYRVKARMRQTVGTGTAFVGVAGVNSYDVALINAIGSGGSNYSSQHYFAAEGIDLSPTWTEVVGYFSGHGEQTSGNGGYHPEFSDPGKLHPNADFFRPLILVNYNGEEGVTQVDYIRVEEVKQDPIISADSAARTFHVGGFSDLVFTPNVWYNSNTENLGEIRVQGSLFYHPDGTQYPIATNKWVATPFETTSGASPTSLNGTVVQETFFVTFSVEDVNTRFNLLNIDAQTEYSPNFFVSIYDEHYDTWFAIDNANTRQPFDPIVTDCIVAIGKKNNYAGGINSLTSLLSSGGALSVLNTVSYGDLDEDAQGLIDGKVVYYFEGADPSSAWDAEKKAQSVGDLWFVTASASNDYQKLFRYTYSDPNYSWEQVTERTAVDAAIAASNAQDTADGKRRVFTSTPTPPYDVGDLWDRGAATGIWRCNTAKASGGTYALSDWQIIADRTSLNTAAGFAGQGAFATLSQITSTNITTFIEGAAIDTAFIKEAAIETALIDDAAITEAKIDNLAVTTAKIDDAAITTAKIEDAAITTAKIGLAQVDTLELAGQAVTIPSGDYTGGTITPSGETTIQQVTFTSTGAEVFINFTCICESFAVSGTSYTDLRLYRDTTLIQNFGQMAKMPYGNAMPLAVSIKDEPSAGAHTYYMKVGSYTGVRFKARSMTALEVKR